MKGSNHEYLPNKLESNEVLFLQETLFPTRKKFELFICKAKSFFSWYMHLFWCFNSLFRFKSSSVKNTVSEAGLILILNVTVDNTSFVLINVYNANTETEQIKVLNRTLEANAVTPCFKKNLCKINWNFLFSKF